MANIGGASTPALPIDHSPAAIRDPHHYANIVTALCSPGNGVSAKFLDAPTNKRNYLALRNNSATANIYIEFDRDASTHSVIRLTPNTMVLFDVVVPQNDIYAIADAASAELSYGYSTIV
jgi:hypothetical protein